MPYMPLHNMINRVQVEFSQAVVIEPFTMSIIISTCIYKDNNYKYSKLLFSACTIVVASAIPDRSAECFRSLFLGFGDKNSLPGREM